MLNFRMHTFLTGQTDREKEIIISSLRELYRKWKVQYSWPPCTN